MSLPLKKAKLKQLRRGCVVPGECNHEYVQESAMVPETDWDAPAHLQFEPMGTPQGGGQQPASDVVEFPSLREAVHWAMNNEAPAGTHAVIRTASGEVIEPSHLE